MTTPKPGFEYDIFISYRQNDNQSGWVTDFVRNLQVEMSATLKDPISIYFDSNPYDGLLETHHVDKSLEGKLKSLIFIPILSQTYCDPKSFAWKQEFSVFNRLAQEDLYGRDIKLNNGNVASRILPIQIHNLDLEDGSMSMWMMRAFGQNLLTSPTTRSSKRAPIATSTSHSCIAMLSS